MLYVWRTSESDTIRIRGQWLDDDDDKETVVLAMLSQRNVILSVYTLLSYNEWVGVKQDASFSSNQFTPQIL